MVTKNKIGEFEQPILPKDVLARHVFNGDLEKVQKANPDLMKKAEKTWGYTEDPSKGGFILLDGRVLNMNNGECLPNELNREAHREIFGILDLDGEICTQDEAVDLFEKLTGGIRFYFGRFDNQIGFSLSAPWQNPSIAQKIVLQVLADIGANFHYDIYDDKGKMLACGKGLTAIDMRNVFRKYEELKEKYYA